MTLHWG